jgi:3-oxoadipate enol-lactonase
MTLHIAHTLDGPADAPPLVLSGSLGTTSRIWEPQMEEFATRFRVLRHDHPGHGRSPVPTEAFSIEDLARAVLSLADEAGFESFAYSGLSLGGMIGMWASVLAPGRVTSLTLCCTGAKLGTSEEWFDRAATVREEGVQAFLPRLRERWFTPAFRDSEAARACFEEVLQVPREGYARCCEAIGGFDFRSDLERIQAPTLILAGEEDPLTLPEVTALLSDRIADSTTTIVPGAAHLASVEQADFVTAAMLRHLEAKAPA